MSELKDIFEEALKYRFEGKLLSSYSDPQEVMESLMDYRRRADRVEEIFYKFVHLRAQAQRDKMTATLKYDQAWAEAMEQAKKNPVRQGDSFVGPRERYADADLASLVERRELYKAEQQYSVLEEMHDILRNALRGLNDVCQDHRSWLRTLQFQSNLDV